MWLVHLSIGHDEIQDLAGEGRGKGGENKGKEKDQMRLKRRGGHRGRRGEKGKEEEEKGHLLQS